MRITEERIRAAAEATLQSWPAATAVLLFGSRARGDHRPASDWDLAVVTDDPRGRPRHLPLIDLADLNPRDIDLTFISHADIRRHRNRLGRLGCALARDARPIAGNWRPPAGLKEPTMDHVICLEEIENSLRCFRNALRVACDGMVKSSAIRARSSAGGFVHVSADAAEHLAKAMLVRGGHQPRRIHDLGDLADDIAAGNPELAGKVRSLNGRTKDHHTRHYGDRPPPAAADVAHAARRLQRTGRLLAAELPHWRDSEFRVEMEGIESNANDLRHAREAPLDETRSEAALAAMALRDGRAAVSDGADALLAAWRAAPEAEDPAAIRQAGFWLDERGDLHGDAAAVVRSLTGLTDGEILAGSPQAMAGTLADAARQEAELCGIVLEGDLGGASLTLLLDARDRLADEGELGEAADIRRNPGKESDSGPGRGR